MTSETGKALGDVLATARYDEESVRELVQQDGLDFGRGLAALRLRPSADERLSRLVRLFLAADVLTAPFAAAALAPLTLEALVAAGIVEQRDDGVRSLVRLDPIEQLIVASDPQVPQRRFTPDHVIAPGPASRALAAVTIRSQVGVALDLCCGSGVQALLAARHAGHVVATDLNPRALQLASLSAALSGLENVEWRSGDLFEPVRDERFELVVSNPPFVISPARDLTFRDGGRRGDELSHLVITGIAESLADRGFGHALCSWVCSDGEHWSETPRRWLAGCGCDAAILHLDSEGPVTHAIRWTSVDAPTPAAAVAQAAEWVDHYRELGIERIATGIVVLRRRAGRNWIHCDELVAARPGSGEHLARIFAGHDALEHIAGDGGLLSLPLALGPGVSLVERRAAGGRLERARLTADAGMQLPARVTPPPAAATLLELNGVRTLAEAGARAGVAAGVLEAALPCIRNLVERGYVVSGGRADPHVEQPPAPPS
jgi:methylase of polypeptide subunit release factors